MRALKGICFVFVSLLITISLTNSFSYAQTNYYGYFLEEYLVMKEENAEIYEFYDDEGDLAAYYVPNISDEPLMSTHRYSSSINWTILSGKTMVSNAQHSMRKDTAVSVLISQNVSGTSYLGLYDNTNAKLYIASASETTNGWDGTLYAPLESSFSLAIENASSLEITYVGTFSF